MATIGRTIEGWANVLEKRVHIRRNKQNNGAQGPKARKGTNRRMGGLLCHAALIAMSTAASTTAGNSYTTCAPFDTDSRPAGIDNRCSGCISHDRNNFPGELRQCNRAIKVFGGERMFRVWIGTIQRHWDDDGVTHRMLIPNLFYIPDGKVRLLSPQHWAQQRRNNDKRGGQVPPRQEHTAKYSGTMASPRGQCQSTPTRTMLRRLTCPQGSRIMENIAWRQERTNRNTMTTPSP